MPARNVDHDAVRDALIADGWTITADPLRLQFGGRDLYVDLGAERSPLAAERGGERIAVEVQSFSAPSDVKNLQDALGQYQMYQAVLADVQPDRKLYLAVARDVYDGILTEPLGLLMVSRFGLSVLVYDPARREVTRWIS